MPKHEFIVSPGDTGVRLDIFLKDHLPDDHSRTFVKHLIEDGKAAVNGAPAKAHHKVAAGEKVSAVVDPESPGEDIAAEPVALDVFYEDEHLLAVNKPAGMLVHPASGVRTGTLVNALLHHCSSLSTVNEKDRPGIVHRLDRETSGLILAAKDNRTHENLARQFERHKVRKHYVALVQGSVVFDEGRVDVPLGRDKRHFDKRGVSFEDDARQATTHYRVIKRSGKTMTLVSLFPRSGRTHQLRVHMAHLGHPVLGDEKYGRKGGFSRMALHARGIGFYHPAFHTWTEFQTPVPGDFLKAVECSADTRQ